MDKRDIVLSAFFDQTGKHNLIKNNMKLLLLSDYKDKINEIEFDRILKQFIADGYVNISLDGNQYIPTEKLEDINYEGGFVQKRINLQAERIQKARNSNILLAASLIGGCYYLIEILKWIYHNFCGC